ncbi:cell surface glycoprotein CD200 receptor 1-like isoform X3 [Anas acuta]
MMWKYSPDRDPALRIYPVNLSDEGNYTCEIATDMGNFHFSSSLSVIVPPTVTLTSDKSRVAVCQAAAGKPAAKISWIPASNNSSEEEFKHGNGTVTRVSYIGWVNSMNTTVTCLVTHPAMNQNLSLDLSDSSSRLHYPLVALPASVAAISGFGVLLCLIFTCRAYCLRKLAHEPPVLVENSTKLGRVKKFPGLFVCVTVKENIWDRKKGEEMLTEARESEICHFSFPLRKAAQVAPALLKFKK